MKRILAALLSAALLLSLLPACVSQEAPGSSRPAESDASGPEPTPSAPEEPLLCADVMITIWAELDFGIPEAQGMYSELDSDAGGLQQLEAYIEGAYGLAAGEWEAAAVARSTGATATELAVLRFADEEAAAHGEERLKEYLHAREGDFTGYAPDQAKLVADGAVCRRDRYMGLFILEDSAAAQSLFENIMETGRLPDPPEPTPAPGPIQDAAGLLDRYLEHFELAGENMSNLERVDSGDPDRLKSIIEEEYGLGDYPWTDAAIVRGTEGNAFEVAVLRIDADLQTGMDAVEVLNAYLDAEEGALTRFPAQAELFHNAIAAWSDGYIALLACHDPERAAIMLGSYVNGSDSGGYSTMRRHREPAPLPSTEPDPVYPDREKFVRPNKEDMSIYDTSAIRAAWAEGDPAPLSAYDRAIYDAARQVLDQVLTEGMTDLEKETAIYRWIVDTVNYDWRHQDILAVTPRESYTPYGGLVDHTAVCLGYAAAFQLLCDLSGVECITVAGAAFHSEEDHAWNMVRLNGQWYCVDVTWDANGREQLGDLYPRWQYFNITSDQLASTNHQWDYANTPEAVAADGGQG